MKVVLYASLRDVVGERVIVVTGMEGSSPQHLIMNVLREYPKIESLLVDEYGNLFEHVRILVNGRDVRFLERGMDSHLEETDEVSIFPAIGGG